MESNFPPARPRPLATESNFPPARPKPSRAPPKPSSKRDLERRYQESKEHADQAEYAAKVEQAEYYAAQAEQAECAEQADQAEYATQAEQAEYAEQADQADLPHGYPEGFQIIRESRYEAKLMLTMPGFTRSHISRMIGKRGSNLLGLSRESGAKVHLCGRDSNRPTNEPNYLWIRGNESTVDKALDLSCQKVMEVLETEIPECDHCGGDHKSRDCTSIRQPYFERIFLDPSANVGFIIGSGGRNIQPIKEATGALIRMCGIGAGELHATEPLHMRIECRTEDALAKAVHMAEDLIERVAAWSPYDDVPPKGHNFLFRQKIELEFGESGQGRQDFDSLNAHLLGKRGQNFRQIHETTGAWLWLRGQGSGMSGSESREQLHLLIEHDDSFQLKQAVQMAQELLDRVETKLRNTVCNLCGGAHFAYRCTKANSAGYLKEMKGKAGGKGGSEQGWPNHKPDDWSANKQARWS